MFLMLNYLIASVVVRVGSLRIYFRFITTKTRLAKNKSAIEFRNVEFHYQEDEDEEPQPILKGISFKVERGSRVALVGPSGAGKSTVFSLSGDYAICCTCLLLKPLSFATPALCLELKRL